MKNIAGGDLERLRRHQVGAAVVARHGVRLLARGGRPRQLGHWVTISGGKVERYQAVVPATWLAGGRDAHGKQGPYEESLAGNGKHPLARKEQPLEPLRTIHSFDPCARAARSTSSTPRGARGSKVVTP